jgi:predicted PurR-regulated permease PerM
LPFFCGALAIGSRGAYTCRYINGVVLMFRSSRRARAWEVIGAMGSKIRGWLLGQLTSMTFPGIFMYVGLLLLGIRMQ